MKNITNRNLFKKIVHWLLAAPALRLVILVGGVPEKFDRMLEEGLKGKNKETNVSKRARG